MPIPVRVPVPAGATAEVVFDLFGRACSNQLWFTSENPDFTSSEMSALAAVVETWMTTNYLPHVSADLNYRFTTITDKRVLGGFALSSNFNRGPGGVGIRAIPANAALVIVLYPVFGVLRKPGRMYVPGWPLDYQAHSMPDHTLADNMAVDVSALIDAASAEGWNWSVVSLVENGVPRSSGLAARVSTCQARTASLGQRRMRLKQPPAPFNGPNPL